MINFLKNFFAGSDGESPGVTFSHLIPPDEQLISVLRYPVPSRFLEPLAVIRGIRIPPPPDYLNAGDPIFDSFGFEWSKAYTPWFTPPELCIFGWQGGGAYFGHLLLTPEIPVVDAPVFYGAYTDSDLPMLVARNSDEFFQLRGLRFSPRAGKAAVLENVMEDCDGFPELDEAVQAAWRPVIPNGYRYSATEDNIGVLAPAAAFHPDHDNLQKPDFGKDPEGYFGLSADLLHSQYSASALTLLKNIHRILNGEDERWMELSLEAYRRLGRPLHVENLLAAEAHRSRRQE